MLHKNGVRPVVAVVGIDIGKNNFHVVAHDKSGAIVLRQKCAARSRAASPTCPRALSAWRPVSALITSLAG